MAVNNLGWFPFAEDIHLAPGFVSPRLLQSLRIFDDAFGPEGEQGDSQAVQDAGIQVTFSSTPAAVGTGPRQITVDPVTGEVKVRDPLPPLPAGTDWPQTMIVKAKVSNFTPEIPMRIVIHRAFDRIWLAPNDTSHPGADGLTVRVSAVVPGTGQRTSTRFSVMAKFTDGEIADLNNWCPSASLQPQRGRPADQRFVRHLQPDGALEADPALWWSLTGTSMTIDPASGFLACTSATATVTVKAEIKPIGSGPTASAAARGAPAWSTPLKVEPINRTSFPNMADGQNFLILPDGFDATQEQEFRQLAAQIVRRLDNESLTSPYQHLKHKFNYFLAWVPSPVSTISVLNEVQKSTSSEYDVFQPVPPRPPRTDRCLINERNTAFHCAFGFRPSILRRADLVPRLNPLRLEPDDFEDFLKALTDANGNSVGATWAQGGKDETLVCILCRYFHQGGANNDRGNGKYLTVPLGRVQKHRLETNPAGNGFDVKVQQGLGPPKEEERIELLTFLTMAHEFAHSFGLEDEYGDLPGPVPAALHLDMDSAANVQRRETLLDALGKLDATKIKWKWGRIAKAGILTANPVPSGARFVCTLKAAVSSWAVADSVRLRAPPLSDPQRVTNVDVSGDSIMLVPATGSEALVPETYPAGSFLISGALVGGALIALPQSAPPDAGRFLCLLQAGQATSFKSGQIVRVRTRDIVMPPSPRSLSDPMTVTRVQVLPNNDVEVEVEPLPGSAPPVPVMFPARSTLIAVRSAPATATSPSIDLPLVEPRVAARIGSTKNPLNAAPNAAIGRPCSGGLPGNNPTPARNFQANQKPKHPTNFSLIVGLYETADQFLCGAFRPAGTCMMRNVEDKQPFCPVCRYAIVDLVDPAMHSEIDREYERDYPKW